MLEMVKLLTVDGILSSFSFTISAANLVLQFYSLNK